MNTSTPDAIRANTVTIGNDYEQHASQFDYSEAADRAEIFGLTLPEMLTRLKDGERIVGDCASTWEATRKDAGGRHLPPLGWTGSELDTMPHIELSKGLVGDGIVIGEYPGKHVVWISKPDPVNPMTYGHGEPGFTEVKLLDMMESVFPGEPYTVLSLTPYLPAAPADPHHYHWFSSRQVEVANGRSSERESVMHYDQQRLNLARHQASLFVIEENLLSLIALLESTGKNTPHEAWRARQMRLRANGEQLVK